MDRGRNGGVVESLVTVISFSEHDQCCRCCRYDYCCCRRREASSQIEVFYEEGFSLGRYDGMLLEVKYCMYLYLYLYCNIGR